MTKVTQHFTLAETTVTSTGLNNSPATSAHTAAILNTATNMEIVRAILNRVPININSWYRSPEVNKAVGGVDNSEHALGQAVDFTCPRFGSPFQVCVELSKYANILNYNQLIYEGTWVHISFPPEGVRGKRQLLTMKKGKYYQGLIQ